MVWPLVKIFVSETLGEKMILRKIKKNILFIYRKRIPTNSHSEGSDATEVLFFTTILIENKIDNSIKLFL